MPPPPYDRPGQGEPPLPKPYDFVPFPTRREDRQQPMGHDRYVQDRRTGSLEGTLTALSPVHVASGSIELRTGRPSLMKAHFRSGGRPVIPATSLKGAIRSIVEAISAPPSCMRTARPRLEGLPRNVQTCGDPKLLCVACRLFGAMGYMGRIQFRDAVLEEGKETQILTIPSLFAPRPREHVYYNGNQLRGRKFYMHGLKEGKPAPGNVPIEVCPKDSIFTVRIDFENLTDGELGLLWTALGQGNTPFIPKIGGGKPACCGSVQPVFRLVLAQAPSALDFDPPAQNPPDLNQRTEMVDPESLRRLAEILQFPGERRCPDRNY